MEKPLIKYFKDGEWHYATVKDIGDLDTLNTLEKSTIVDAINSIVIDGRLSNEATINTLNQIKDKVQIVEGKIDTHIADRSNPHNVTTEQIGTYNKETIDSKDGSILSSAKAYVDGVKTALTGLINDVKNNTYTKTDIDSKDSNILTQAKNYINGIKETLEQLINNAKTEMSNNTYTRQEIDSKDSSTLSSAKGYTDTKKSEANSYTNTQVNNAKTEIKNGNVASATKLQTARNINGVAFDGTRDISISAGQIGAYTKSETDNKDSNILSQSKSYTDGKFTPLNNTVNSINGRVGTAETNINNINNRINDATIIARTGNGKQITSDPFFDDGTNGIVVYNNSNNGTVTITRENPSDGTQPTGHRYRLKIVHTGTASPNLGGFVRRTISRVNAEFVVKFNAYLPSGTSLSFYNNLIGTGSSIKWLTSNLGTSAWQEYSYYVKCGASGTFQDFGFTAINYSKTPTPSEPLTWYVSSFEIYDISSSQAETIGLMERNISNIRNDLTNHTNNRSNPHSVTASQVGAYTKAETDKLINNAKSSITTSSIGTYTKSEIDTKDTTTLNSAKSYADGKATSVQNNLNGHTNNRSNPHGVTASQVGTYTKQEIDSKDSSTLSSAKGYADSKANTVQNNLNSHTGNRSNPHGVTAGQVGAYTKSEVDNLVRTGVGNIDVGGVNYMSAKYIGKFGTVTSYTYNQDTATGRFTVTNAKPSWGCGLYFSRNDVLLHRGETFFLGITVKPNMACTCAFDVNNRRADGQGSGNDLDVVSKRRYSATSLPANVWTRVWVMYTAGSYDIYNSSSVFGVYTSNASNTITVDFKDITMVKSNVPVEYSVPEQVYDTRISNSVNDLRNHVIFVGTESQWNGLSSTEKNKYILKAIVE